MCTRYGVRHCLFLKRLWCMGDGYYLFIDNQSILRHTYWVYFLYYSLLLFIRSGLIFETCSIAWSLASLVSRFFIGRRTLATVFRDFWANKNIYTVISTTFFWNLSFTSRCLALRYFFNEEVQWKHKNYVLCRNVVITPNLYRWRHIFS